MLDGVLAPLALPPESGTDIELDLVDPAAVPDDDDVLEAVIVGVDGPEDPSMSKLCVPRSIRRYKKEKITRFRVWQTIKESILVLKSLN